MKLLTSGTVARVYLVVALMLSTLFASFFQLGVALVLLVIEVYSIYKPLGAGSNLVLVVASLVVAPLAFEALIGMYGVLLVFPALFLLDECLCSYALTQRLAFRRIGRGASDVLRALSVGLFLVFGVSVLTWNFTLMFTTSILLGYLGVMVVHDLLVVPKLSLQEEKSWSRVIVGNDENTIFSLNSRVNSALLVSLRAMDDWVSIGPSDFRLKGNGEVRVSLKFCAPLAGPSKIQVEACYVDCRGLVLTGQVLEPLCLHIIPRAKYAAWLAGKFLEGSSGGGGAADVVQSVNAGLLRQGIEYFGSRSYQTGDRLKNIDWKHSYMLGELIVKEFSSSRGQVGVVLADLSADSLEDADLLAYHLVMSALTFASEGLPAGLAAYGPDGVVSVVAPTNAREVLKEALALTGRIEVAPVKGRVLEGQVGRRLERSIGELALVEGLSAERLGEVLMFERLANEEAVRVHPAALALDRVMGGVCGSCVVAVVSGVEGDGVLGLVLEGLVGRGVGVVDVRTRKVLGRSVA